jgi:trehalose-phosphatase
VTGAPPGSPPGAIAAGIDRLTRGVGPLLVVVDFDGTLAVGTRDPAAARITTSARRALRTLASLGATEPARVQVAVLTGRTVLDVASRVRVGGIEYLGDHGLQHAVLPRHGRVDRLVVTTDPAWGGHTATAETLAREVAVELGDPPWLFVERKGPSVAFHVRQADDVAAARAAVLAAIDVVEARADLVDHGLAHYRGRSVVDLRPAAAGGKREAVRGLVERHRPGAVVVLGDELSDVDAFEAVIAARDSGAIGIGVTVAVHGEARPAPPELLAVADVTLASARAVGPFLAGVARRLADGEATKPEVA